MIMALFAFAKQSSTPLQKVTALGLYPTPATVVKLIHKHGKTNWMNMWQRNILGKCRTLHSASASGASRMQKNSSNGRGENRKENLSLPSGLITSTPPPNIQVFADPTLSKCVRDLTADMQKVKSTLKYTKEEVADCVYEYIQLNNSYDALKSTVKETSKFSKELAKETQSNSKMWKDKYKELENCLLYFTEKTVAHENQMLEINIRQDEIKNRLEEFVSNLDCVIDQVEELRISVHEELKPEIDGMRLFTKLLGADDGSLVVDVKKITEDLVRIRQLLNSGDCEGKDWTDYGVNPKHSTGEELYKTEK